jgi:nitroreductase
MRSTLRQADRTTSERAQDTQEVTMTARTLFERRFSCRIFGPSPPDRETVVEVLEAARWAPNGGNLQPWRFVIARDDSHRRGLAGAASGQGFLSQAPVVITVCAVPEESGTKYGTRGRDLYCLQDTAAAAQNILLAATDRGLGSCWVGAFDEAAVIRVLDLPASWRPVALIALGEPAEAEPHRTRRPLSEVTRWLE